MASQLGSRRLQAFIQPFSRSRLLSSFRRRSTANTSVFFSFANALVSRPKFSTLYKKRHDNALQTSSANHHSPISTNPESLVCKRCWDDIFSTKDWERACLYTGVAGSGYRPQVTHTALIREIKQSAEQSCSFCAMLWEYIGPELKSEDIDVKYTSLLCPTEFANSTPGGMQTWYFSLDTEYNNRRHGSWSLRICCHTTEGDRAAKFVSARPIQRDVFSTKAQDKMQSWIKECAKHHCCPTQDDTSLPSRIIDVSSDGGSDKPRVMSLDGQKGKYAILSYHWGPSQLQHRFTSSNISEYMQYLNTESLPATIRDGIAVTRALNLKYLWVDSLCIIQDSKDDQLRELAQIEDYYRNAHVAIIAASSHNVSQGFLQPRQRLSSDYPCTMHVRESWPVPFSVGNGKFGTIYFQCMKCEAVHREDEEPINQRAWAFQEQLLPPRQLIFSSHTLQWRCHSSLGIRNLEDSNHYELYGDVDGQSNSLRELNQISHTPIQAFIQWQKVVSKYTFRAMSVESDKLLALSSIAKRYQSFLGAYHAGIWEYNFLWQLRWTTSRYEDDEARLTKSYRAPSWSWASLDGDIGIDYAVDQDDLLESFNDHKPHCELIHVETQLKDPKQPYGEVTGGHIVLRGKPRHGWLIRSKRSLNGPRTVVWTTDEESSLSTAQAKYDLWANDEKYLMREVYDEYVEEYIDDPKNPWIGAQHDLRDEHSPMKVVCLPLFKRFGLLLQPATNGSYKRVGSFEWFNWEADFEHQKTINVRIV